MGLQLRPQRPLPFRMIGQPRRRAADADVALPFELHRAAHRRRNFQQHQSRAVVVHHLEAQGNRRLQPLRQPQFQRLAADPQAGGLEAGADGGMVAIANAPQQPGAGLVDRPRRIGECRHQAADHLRIDVVLLELHARRFRRQPAQVIDQGQRAGVGHRARRGRVPFAAGAFTAVIRV
jgi:hypothetical protein